MNPVHDEPFVPHSTVAYKGDGGVDALALTQPSAFGRTPAQRTARNNLEVTIASDATDRRRQRSPVGFVLVDRHDARTAARDGTLDPLGGAVAGSVMEGSATALRDQVTGLV